MTSGDILTLLQGQFPTGVVSIHPEAMDPYAVVLPGQLIDIGLFLRDDPRLQFHLLNDLTAVDYLEIDAKKAAKAGFDPHLEVVYHLSSVAFPGRRIKLKIILPRWKNDTPGELPEVPSVAGVWRTADWHEREAYDLVGVRFTEHPNLQRILLADDYPGHPLRKDFEYPLEYHGIRCR
jgi:NADH-quinone oxidoreductase subunit C